MRSTKSVRSSGNIASLRRYENTQAGNSRFTFGFEKCRERPVLSSVDDVEPSLGSAIFFRHWQDKLA